MFREVQRLTVKDTKAVYAKMKAPRLPTPRAMLFLLDHAIFSLGSSRSGGLKALSKEGFGIPF